MADPLSIAASIAGLLSLADIVFLRLSKYIKSVKNAEKEINDLCKEVNLVGGTVNMLSRLATSLEAEDESPIQGFRMHHVDGCAAILSEIVNKTKKYEDKSGGRLKKLFWPYTSSKTKEMLADLSRHKENMNLALSATSLEALLRCLAKEEERERTATAILADVQKTKEIAVRIQEDTRRRRTLDFFLRYNPQSNYEMSVKLRHPRTGMWLERHSSFQQWLRTQGSRLWLSGIPGAGKTVLAGSIIGHALARSSDTVAVGFFFCDYKDETTQSPVNILGGLAYQLAIQSEKAYSMLEEYYLELYPDKGLPRSPSTEDLGRTILRMCQVFEHTYIVVDGLDECGDHAEEVVEALCDIAENSDELSMALLSRDEDDIQRYLRDSEKKFLNIEIAAHTDDITEFLTSEIERRIRSRKLVFDDLSLKVEILESLVTGAHGMFRWVACQLDHLGGCDSDEQCREALRSLPPDLPETYMRILRRVSPAKQIQVQMTLHFIAYAEPRLDIEQLREILSIPSTSQHLSPSGIIREDAIARYCSSLIRKSNDGKYFEFAHFSVQEFLTSDVLQSSGLGMFYITKSHCNKLLAVRCLEYLQLDNFNHLPTATSEELHYMEQRDDEYRLYSYAAEYWLCFAREEWTHPDLLAMAKRLFDPQKSTQFTSWVVTLILNLSYYAFGGVSQERIDIVVIDMMAEVIHDSFRPLHFAATMSLPEISSFLLQTSDHHETKCMLGTPIKCAVSCLCGALGHFDYFDDYLDNHDLARFQRYTGTDSLELSYTIETVGLFLGMNLQAPEDLLRVSLSEGIRMRNLSVAQLLVDKGLVPTQSDLDYFKTAMNTILYDGVLYWGEENLSSLCKFCEALSYGIDTSPLHLEFCQSAWEYCLQNTPSLTDLEGYNISSKVTDDARSLKTLAFDAVRWSLDITVLQRVVDDQRVDVSSILSHGHEDGLLHALVRSGTDGRASEDSGWFVQAEKILDLLLSVGCSLSKRNRDGHTPLTLAIKEGLIGFAETILKRCENEPMAWECQTPILLLVAESGSEGILDLLRSIGLKVRLADYEQKTPLHCLKGNAELTLVKKLESLVPNARLCRSNAKLPWECYVATMLAVSYFRSSSVDVLEYLIQPLVPQSNPSDASKVWEYFASRTLGRKYLTFGHINEAVKCLVRVGIFDAYEKDRSTSALLPIAEACSNEWLVDPSSNEHFLLTDDTLCFLLKATTHWNSFQESLYAVELLKVSSTLNYSMTVDWLLARGIGVHRRCKGVSTMEHICALPAAREDDNSRVRQLLDHADPVCLNHTNPTSGLGLIHISNEKDVPQFRHGIVEMLLGRGVIPDLRISIWPRSSALVYHLSKKHFDLAATLLHQGADPTIPCRSGWTAIHAAIARDNVSFLSDILKHSDPIWKIDWEGQSNTQRYKGIRPLHQAAMSSVDCLLTILEKVVSISLEAPAENGYTAVHFAVVGRKISAVELLHARGANINARSVDGQLALHIAVAQGNLAAVERLLELGSEMTPDCDGMTPLLLAYEYNNQEIIDCLRAHDKGQHGAVSGGVRSTALSRAVLRAVRAGNLSSCQQLLAPLSRVNIDLPEYTSGGCTALGAAVSLGKLKIMTWLLQQGANANCPHGKNSSIIGTMISKTCLNPGLQAMLERYTATGGGFMNEPKCLVSTAVKANNAEGLKILLDHLKANRKPHAEQVGASSSDVLALAVNRKWQGKTPLQWAAYKNNASVVQLLIDNGADLEAKDYCGCTALLISAQAPGTVDYSAVMRVLLQAGSNISCRDDDGFTPIAEAYFQGNPNTISALGNWTPDLLVRDYRGRNLLHCLLSDRVSDESFINRTALFIKLTRMGVSPYEADMLGCSALHLSVQYKSMTAFLLNGNIQLRDERPIPWSTLSWHQNSTNSACLTTAFRLYRRKLSTEEFRTLLNLEAHGPQNPLRFAASTGQIQIIDNILSLGSPIDFEGCPEGSALMAASSAGNLESVIYLVRHGASICFQGHKDFRSAVKLAATSPRVLRWLLVDRFTDQKKLDQSCHASTSPSADYKPWSGIQKAEMIISGRWERQPHESSQQYWARLSNMTEDFRGKFLPPNSGKTTRRQSKLVPSESVKIAADGYFVPHDASVGERVTRKSKWSELSLEVRECLERFCL
ncbi:hypothetical protein CCUS01_09042 [Colletotrichum cuscutae]|uniref:Nephrocystin 3-like N-terminal domain-containing protein n=1 Tax=Colletotrichum cuscutae TaxID=1209917 RepID=A0AAI9UMP1_9PEZI|nr:hypothetical protein CCUS01_09042 [Colletotrichum cuscutae]